MKLNKLDISSVIELFHYLNNLELEYRDMINVNNKNMTFGVELEFLGLLYDDVLDLVLNNKFTLPIEDAMKISNKNVYAYTTESTTDVNGCEITTPILKDKKRDWKNLQIMCNDLTKYGAYAKGCATHMHFGAHIIGTKYDSWINLIKIWITYEKILYNFYYGEDNGPRKSIYTYARSINDIRFNEIDRIKRDNHLLSVLKLMCSNGIYIGKQLGINIFRVSEEYGVDYKNTIEVRIPNGTLDEKVIQNNINLFSKLLTSVISGKLDVDYLNDKFNNREVVSDINLFNDFDYEDAMHLGDMVFVSDIDKFYYLKQLYKLYDLSEEELDKKIVKVLKINN